jgi:hypothetical protein
MGGPSQWYFLATFCVGRVVLLWVVLSSWKYKSCMKWGRLAADVLCECHSALILAMRSLRSTGVFVQRTEITTLENKWMAVLKNYYMSVSASNVFSTNGITVGYRSCDHLSLICFTGTCSVCPERDRWAYDFEILLHVTWFQRVGIFFLGFVGSLRYV